MQRNNNQQDKNNEENAFVSDASSSSLSNFLAYSTPVVAVVWLVSPINIIQGVYAKYHGLSLTTIASIILLARIFDAVTDPLIGHYSDKYRRRTGTRKPIILFGGLLLMISSYFLYIPYGEVSAYYFACWFMALYLALTVFEIPHVAWASEIARTSESKAKIYSVRSMAGYLGLILFYSVPMLPFFETQDITPKTLEISMIIAGILILPLLYVCIKNTPNGLSSLPDSEEKISDLTMCSQADRNQAGLFGSIVGNKPLLLFLGAYLFYGIGAGMWYGMIFLYVDGYLGLGENFAKMFLLAFVLGLAITPIWCKLSINFGKKNIMAIAMALLIASFFYTGTLTPGEAGLQELIILKIVNTIGNVCIVAIAPAMLSEIIDYSAWKYRSENTATYFSLFTFITKANSAAGMALGLAIAGWYGFDATTTVQSPESVTGLMLSMKWLPVSFVFVALLLTVCNPINIRRHRTIRHCLDRRSRRAQRSRTLGRSEEVSTVAGAAKHYTI